MRILALNCGSSSIKAAILDGAPLRTVVSAHAAQIGSSKASLQVAGREQPLEPSIDIAAAARVLLTALLAQTQEHPIHAVVHRIVHGGDQFTRPTRIDEQVLATLDELGRLAPLHNPHAVAALRSALELCAAVPHFAVFDTAFHSTLPPRAREYALAAELRAKFGIRRFGFHGISHAHVMDRVADQLGTKPQDLRIVSCHLGNGASVTAIEYGRSVETSMGMTPMEGLVMGTRCGDIDPGVLLELLRTFDRDALEHLLNQQAGLTGLTGTNDLRTIERQAEQGDENCRLALNLYAHRVRKYLGAYAATMGGVDAIAFTGGIGENSPLMRHRCLQRLDFLGARLDEDRNRDAFGNAASACAEISAAGSRVKLFVVRADEELAMANAILQLLDKPTSEQRTRIPIAVSARHAHLSQPTLERLFGPGYVLQPRAGLSQTGQFSAQDSVSLIGPRGRIDRVRLMGPPREHDQIEISRTDEFALGVDAPVRISGDLANTPGIMLEGSHGKVTLSSGLITARRHIHMNPEDGRRLGVQDCEVVSVRIDSNGRDLTFNDVMVRIAPSFTLELHLDTDEANAAGVSAGDYGELIVAGQDQSRISGMS